MLSTLTFAKTKRNAIVVYSMSHDAKRNTKQNWKYNRVKKSWCFTFKIDNLKTLISDCEWKLMFCLREWWGQLRVRVYVCASLEYRTSVSILNEQLSVPPLIPVSSGKMMVTHNLNKPPDIVILPSPTKHQPSAYPETECSKRLSLCESAETLTTAMSLYTYTHIHNTQIPTTPCLPDSSCVSSSQAYNINWQYLKQNGNYYSPVEFSKKLYFWYRATKRKVFFHVN